MDMTGADLPEDDSTQQAGASLKQKITRLEMQKAKLMAALDSLLETPGNESLCQDARSLLDDIREEDEQAR